ncbi:Rab GTPase ypt31 [Coemansia helicoidea]|uniref:Rab GTPase ypt31 n=1 Tax=Coemansia helicoidea TaxID=1286919 RepID=A0ACC1L4B8_9FUNG|nr:Rab GTPase ypt31 [Coemansia helicoidea]
MLNGLFFIETSALDSSNVEQSFQQILTEIYRIVSNKAIESSQDNAHLGSGAQPIHVPAVTDYDKMTSGCC